MTCDIIKFTNEYNPEELHETITQSFMTVAREFNLTPENTPTNPAFISLEKLKKSIYEEGVDFFIATDGKKIIGCVGIQKGKAEGEYYIERLAVLPGYRHNGIGKKLLDKGIEEIKTKRAKKASIGIMYENERLRKWYLRYGFAITGTKIFDHLPFTVCFMSVEFD